MYKVIHHVIHLLDTARHNLIYPAKTSNLKKNLKIDYPVVSNKLAPD